MSNQILVTYASRTGTTASYAEAIGKTLREKGGEVDVLPLEQVSSLAPYQAVVIGSAIRKSKWLPEAADFVRDHRQELLGKKHAMFSVCITLAMSNSPQYRTVAAGWVQPVSSLLKPISEGFFPGMLNFEKLPFNLDTLKLRLTVALGIFPRGDRRDWQAVRSWAEDLAPMLG